MFSGAADGLNVPAAGRGKPAKPQIPSKMVKNEAFCAPNDLAESPNEPADTPNELADGPNHPTDRPDDLTATPNAPADKPDELAD